MRLIVVGGSLAVVGSLLLFLGVRGTLSSKPPLQIFPDMKLQPTYHAQGENHFFADRRDMRVPVSGTVPYGGRNYLADAGSPTPNPDFLQADDAYYQGLFQPEARVTGAVGAVSTIGQFLATDDMTKVAGALAAQ